MQELVLRPAGRALDQAVVRRASGDAVREEFEARLTEYGPLAFRVAQGVLRNAADAEDVAQEALLRAFRKFDKLRNPASFRSWIVRVSYRLALDRWRSKKRQERRETAWALPVSASTPLSTEAEVAAQEFQTRLGSALEDLPEKFRLVLILSAIQGYTLEEVSRLLDIPMGTVKSRLFFARKRLAEKLK